MALWEKLNSFVNDGDGNKIKMVVRKKKKKKCLRGERKREREMGGGRSLKKIFRKKKSRGGKEMIHCCYSMNFKRIVVHFFFLKLFL